MNESILKANIFEVKRFAVHDGDGIRTTVFFKGCPLRCVWCHNPEGLFPSSELSYFEHKCTSCGRCAQICPSGAHKIEDGKHTFFREKCTVCGKCENACLSDALKIYGKKMSVDELMPVLLDDREFYDQSGGGVTLSGGECLCQFEFCTELLKRLKKEGINTAVDTCGAVPKEILDSVIPYTDVFLYDVKAIDEDVHIKCTGKTNKQILENLIYLNEKGCSIEVRIPYVPSYNDGQIEKIYEYLKPLKNIKKVKVLPYHNYAASKYEGLGINHKLPNILPTNEEIERAEKLFVK